MTKTEDKNSDVFRNQTQPRYTPKDLPAFQIAMDKYEKELELRTLIQKIIIENQTGDLILDLCNMVNRFTYTDDNYAIGAAQIHVEPFVREMLKLYPESEIPTPSINFEYKKENPLAPWFEGIQNGILESEFKKHILDFRKINKGFGECASDYIGMLEYIKLKYSCTVYNNKNFIVAFNKLFFEFYVNCEFTI